MRIKTLAIAALALMGLTTFFLWRYFKRKNWL